MSSIRIIIHGANGRMGQLLTNLCNQNPDFEIIAAVDRDTQAQLIELEPADVLIDFSLPKGLREALGWCVQSKTALVSGTTGIDELLMSDLRTAAQEIPVFWAPNMSIGVNLSARLVATAAHSLGMAADVEIIEAHHRYKKDAPSGTALQLAEVVASARGQNASEVIVSGRSGDCGVRPDGQIGISSIRAGDLVGEHTVLFQLPGESLEITHKANDRDSFALGAIEASRWLNRQSAGFYDMRDLLSS